MGVSVYKPVHRLENRKCKVGEYIKCIGEA